MLGPSGCLSICCLTLEFSSFLSFTQDPKPLEGKAMTQSSWFPTLTWPRAGMRKDLTELNWTRGSRAGAWSYQHGETTDCPKQGAATTHESREGEGLVVAAALYEEPCRALCTLGVFKIHTCAVTLPSSQSDWGLLEAPPDNEMVTSGPVGALVHEIMDAPAFTVFSPKMLPVFSSLKSQ